MPSTLLLGTSPEVLAERLVQLLEAEAAAPGADPFQPSWIILPNRYLAKWLRLWVGRHRGVVFNVRFDYLLEAALFRLFQQLDPRPDANHVGLLGHEDLRQLVLVGLLESDPSAEDLAPLRAYLQRGRSRQHRSYYRAAWQLADRLAGLLRDYEYHRHDVLLTAWRQGREAYAAAGRHETELERSQRGVYSRLFLHAPSLRDRLEQARGRRLRSLPEYAEELMGTPAESLRRPPAGPPIHLFGMTQLSPLHVRMLYWLGGIYELRVHHLNPLAAALQQSGSPRPQHGLESWLSAGRKSLELMRSLLDGPSPFVCETVSLPPAPRQATLLGRTQQILLGRQVAAQPLPQDRSLQIVACPGIVREVETVYQSILHNLREQPDLQQTDIAVLVTDMQRYRPAIQTVFDRQPPLLRYNLADFSPAATSAYAQAVLAMLELSLQAFTRSRVFELLLNPCFLAKLGVDRSQAVQWRRWVEGLGVYHSWDEKEKAERGYFRSPLFSWRLGLQRLRLGRLMAAADSSPGNGLWHYREVVPFVDLDSSDRRQLDAFTQATDGLLPRLSALRGRRMTGRQWADEVRSLCDEFLAVPADPAQHESTVRDQLFAALERLATLDVLQPAEGLAPGWPLALVREYLAGALQTPEGTRGEYLTGGVTIAALQPIRPVPFRILYVLGLGEAHFPGSDRLSSLDLRARQAMSGDIRQAEGNRFLLLEALLSARQKLYLLYNGRDVQQDEVLHPCGPVNQLKRFVRDACLGGTEFREGRVPLWAHAPAGLAPPPEQPWCDVGVTYSEADRLLALRQGREQGEVALSLEQSADVDRRLAAACRRFPPVARRTRENVPSIALRELADFLDDPAEAALKRHLGLRDEAEFEAEDDEPFTAASAVANGLLQESLAEFAAAAAQRGLEAARQEWESRWAARYDAAHRQCRLPEGTFGEVDRKRLTRLARKRLNGAGGLVALLRGLASAEFCGPALLGASAAGGCARLRFCDLELALGPPLGRARLSGRQPLVWRTKDAVYLLTLPWYAGAEPEHKRLNRDLFEPLLFLLAVQALAAGDGADAAPARQWLGDRAWNFHVLGKRGLVSYRCEAATISPNTARCYLAGLAKEFLDDQSLDLLPFALLEKNTFLQLPWRFPDDETLRRAWPDSDELERWRKSFPELDAAGSDFPSALRRAYVAAFQEEVEEDREASWSRYRPKEVVRLADPAVPDDAFDKLRRRFALLHGIVGGQAQGSADQAAAASSAPRRRGQRGGKGRAP